MEKSAFVTLLKAISTASGVVGVTLGARAGIGRNRFYKLSDGTLCPTDEEVRRLFADRLPEGDIAQLLRRADDHATAFELTVRARACLVDQEQVAAALGNATLKIDYLSVVADALEPQLLESQLTALGMTRVLYEDRSKNLGKLYRQQWIAEGTGVSFQFDPRKPQTGRKKASTKRKRAVPGKKRRFARIAISRFSPRAYALARGLLTLLDLSNHSVTRFDVAIDIGVEFGVLQFLPTEGWKKVIGSLHRKQSTERSKQGEPLESTYLTSDGFESVYEFRRRELLIKIYDWNAAHPSQQSNGPITRIEVQRRFRELRVEHIHGQADPFRDLKFVAPPLAPASGDNRSSSYLEALVIRECSFFGPHLVLPRLPPQIQGRVKRLLNSGSVTPQPTRIFQRDWPSTIRRFLLTLGLA